MAPLPVELQLGCALLVNIALIVAAYRATRRATDTLLIYYLAQYVIVGSLGLVGALHPSLMLTLGAIVAAIFWLFPRRDAPIEPIARTDLGLLLFIIAFAVTLIGYQFSVLQPTNDPLTYHLPAAATWLQQGRITLYETWFYNPANTYSPLAGSMFIAWWMGPLHSDVLARFVQAPAVVLIFFALRDLLCAISPTKQNTSASAFVACAFALCRPVIGQVMLAKDDLFVVAFFIVAVTALLEAKIAWKIGAAIGLLLATKYTALYCVPVLLTVLPLRKSFYRQDFFVAATIAFFLAAPWCLRNMFVAGNPIYPLHFLGLHGMFTAARALELRSIRGVLQALAGSYYAAPVALWAVLIIGWIGAIVRTRGQLYASPTTRLLLGGPFIGIGLFVLTSPYPEARFATPFLSLLFAATWFAVVGNSAREWIASIALFVIAVGTSFIPDGLMLILPVAAILFACGAILALVVSMGWRQIKYRLPIVAMIAFLVGSVIFIYWKATLNSYREEALDLFKKTDQGYGDLPLAWEFVRTNLPSNLPLAYTGTFYTHPLIGEDGARRMIYVPTNRDLAHLHDLPPFHQWVRGDEIQPTVTREMLAKRDRERWFARLNESGAEVLFIARKPLFSGQPALPEIEFTAADPAHFQRIFENADVLIYRIVK